MHSILEDGDNNLNNNKNNNSSLIDKKVCKQQDFVQRYENTLKQTKQRKKINNVTFFSRKNESTLDSDKYNSNKSHEKVSSSKKNNQSFLTNLSGSAAGLYQSDVPNDKLRNGNLLVIISKVKFISLKLRKLRKHKEI